RHKLAVSSEDIGDPHNLLLEIWATAGVFALLSLVVALGFGLLKIFTAPRPTTPDAKESPAPPSEGRPTSILLSGCLGGLILVVVLGGLNPFQEGLLSRWLVLAAGWGLALVCGFQLWQRSPIPAAGAGAGLLAISVNLLAAGGIG